MMVVFTGPTLDPAAVAAVLDADVRPPAAQGDLYRAARERPWAIGLIDGLFETVPSVWHKEVLWALSHGVRVYGAASMGALRAAELYVFGMVGVGDVFDAYRGGDLERDDEVAVAHAPAEHGWRPHSVALVDVRASLDAAVAAGALPPAAAARCLAAAEATFWADRTWESVLAVEPAVRPHRVHRKRADAVAMLERMRADRAADPAPLEVAWDFHVTAAWTRGMRGRRAGGVLDEVRLLGPATWRRVVAEARARVLAIDEARRQGVAADPARVRAIEAELSGRVAPERLSALAAREARARWTFDLLDGVLEPAVSEQLRLDGTLEALAARARAKRPADAADVADLLAWFRAVAPDRGLPADPAAAAAALELDGPADLARLLAAERAYREGQERT